MAHLKKNPLFHSRYSIKEKIIFSTGKIRRFLTGIFNHSYIKEQKKKRRGECIRCGACCKLLFDCPFIISMDHGAAICKIHSVKPLNCRIFPIDSTDIDERDIVLSTKKCGFKFKKKKIHCS